MTEACSNCPFRKDSTLGYDADALENLDNGYEPSCHAKVGTQSIFHIDWPTKTRCKGFDAWQEGSSGFVKPSPSKAAL